MKRVFLIAAIAASIAAPGSAVAAPPQTTADPFTNYLVTRVLPNKNEIVLATFAVTSWDSQEQAIRAATFQYVDQQRLNNPSWRIVMYGPIDPPETYWTNDDRIWDSAVNTP